MAVIYSYPKLSTLQGKDLLLISDVSSKNKPTMRVELDTITSYVNSQIIVGGTNHYLPVFTTSGLGDSIIRQDVTASAAQVLGQLDVDDDLTVAQSAKINDQLVVGGNFVTITQPNLAAPGLNTLRSTPGSTDIARNGVVFIGGFGGSYTGDFTQFDYALNLYTPSNFSDPTNFSDTRAFIYKWNDGYRFARIQSEDGYNTINPMWEVGDLSGETTSARWQVNDGGFARFATPGVPAYFEVTTTEATTNVPLRINEPLLDAVGGSGTAGQVLGSTGTSVEWIDNTGAGAVTGSGTTGYLTVYTDGPNSEIGDSKLRLGPLGNGLYQLTFNDADRFILNKPSSVTGGDPEYLITQDGNFKVSFGWDDDGAGFGYIYNWAGNGLRLGAAGQNPQLELDTATPKIISHTDHEFKSGILDNLNSTGTVGQLLASTGIGVQWNDAEEVVSGAINKLIPTIIVASAGGSSTYSADNNIVELQWTGGTGTYTLNIPSAATIPYRVIRFITDGTFPGGASHKINITAQSPETIDGGPDFEISKTYEGVSVWSTGTEWIVIQAKSH